jgi:hypothetical protein
MLGSCWVVIAISSVVIDDFHIVGITVFEPKAQPPLVVDADAVLAAAPALQWFQAVAGRNAQVVERGSGIELRSFFKASRCTSCGSFRETLPLAMMAACLPLKLLIMRLFPDPMALK